MVELKKESDKTENESVKEETQTEQKEAETTTEASDTSEPVTASEPEPKKQTKLPKVTSFQITKELKIVTGVAVILIIVAGVWGHSAGYQSKIDSQTLKLDAQYKEAYDKLESTKKELKNNEQALKEVEEYKKNEKELNNKLASVNQEITTKSGELQGLTTQVEQKQAELDKLNGDIIQAKGQPISLSAGQFIVGKDIPAGRYNVSGSSNFIVHSGTTGRSKVNTILGDSWVGDGDYVCTLDVGDEIDNHARATLTPIE